ncbi:phosphatidic acid phosphatase type 2/haloperoxidase [Boeremia exigua]|uniref:phosphatidic acid phosphatase type 2/haloperoxidase n=1 Tax=Boeremia exigua TaxID=749465 RepID=UPI001E8EAA79|nr:phosphatidic acid phosphatase type 2/haloperoxidase [Boeremia exigua]KAH6644607.1 phosphatidic acid phosphatase type 2/haloperoxidase [Boeremia exigua]
MPTATATHPRPGLDIHRRLFPPTPPPTPPPTSPPPLPLSTLRMPSLSDIPEERTPRTTSTSAMKSHDGAFSDTEAPRPRFSALRPGFRDAPPFATWARRCWPDVLTQLLCLLVAELVYLFGAPLMPRVFPLYAGVERSAWGIAHGRARQAEYVNTLVSAVVSFAVPAGVMGAVGLWRVRAFWESNAAMMGLGYALATATLFQSFIKWFVGGLRPHFLDYTAAVCTGDAKAVKEAQMSFPSGHSSAAFAGFGFLALYLNSKLNVVGRKPDHARETLESGDEERSSERDGRETRHCKLLVWALPWLVALLIAASKVRDGWHHPVDVLFGAIVGTLFAHMAYHCVFRGVYDGRVNHLPRH